MRKLCSTSITTANNLAFLTDTIFCKSQIFIHLFYLFTLFYLFICILTPLRDSWWYGEYDIYNGVWMWEDNHELLKERFPHGLEWLHDTLGVPFACHMGKWYLINNNN